MSARRQARALKALDHAVDAVDITPAAKGCVIPLFRKLFTDGAADTSTCSNNYGPYHFPEKLIPLTIGKCIKRESIPVYGNGQQVRDWIRVEDHVSGLLTVLRKGVNGEKYNIGSNCELTNIQVVTDICKVLDKLKPNLNNSSYLDLISFVEDRPGHDYRYSIDNKKVINLKWKPKFSWKKGLEDTIKWYLMNEEYKRMLAYLLYWSILDYHQIERPVIDQLAGKIRDLESLEPINGAQVQVGQFQYTTDTYESLFNQFSSDENELKNGFYWFENLPKEA